MNSVLFSSDPNLLRSWKAENDQKYVSASLEMLPISSPDISPSCSVTNLPQSCENGKHRKRNGFFPVRPKPQAFGLKRDRGPTFSSLPCLFSASNISKQSRLKYTAGEKESKEKLKQKAAAALIDIQWDFSEFKKMPCSRIAAFELTSPLKGDKKLLPHRSRPNFSPASVRKFL
jgi:hypothetical protein